MFNSTVNVNSRTGIRFGVVSVNSLDPDMVPDLFYGPDAVDRGYEAAYQEAKKDAETRWDEAHEEAETAALEVDPGMPEADKEKFIERHMIEAGICWTHWDKKFSLDRDEYVEHEMEHFSSCYDNDSVDIDGVYDGVAYHISSLGGAHLLWITEGPVGYANRLCSLCVPNAADLDGGFYTREEFDDLTERRVGHECYVVPRDWLAKQEA